MTERYESVSLGKTAEMEEENECDFFSSSEGHHLLSLKKS